MMDTLPSLREALPSAARDLSLNLASLLESEVLTESQRWEVSLACAFATRSVPLIAAVLEGAGPRVAPGILEDARAAAALMAMNNVFYRFRHMVGKEGYQQRPARLRMNRLSKVEGPKADFELACLAVSSMNGCEVCVRSHEAAVLKGGLGEEQVMEAVRLAATLSGISVALTLSQGNT
jgi:alkyl hydroperoxide reductase subunit D